MPTLLAWFSSYDILVIGLIALLFFGNRLPSVMRSLGEGVTEFKKGINGVEGDDEDKDTRAQPPRKLADRSNVDVDDGVNHDVRKFDEVRKPA
ncbi:MAG TPA: twin-arginine translocase TatA/TatE family subunit [Pirellulales bacterium]